MDRCYCYVCVCFVTEVRDGTLPEMLVCPQRSQPIIPLNYLLTRWNWCFWSTDWIIRNVGHSYSPWLVSLICPIWSPCLSNLLNCTTHSCLTNNSRSQQKAWEKFYFYYWCQHERKCQECMSLVKHITRLCSQWSNVFGSMNADLFHPAPFINLHRYPQTSQCFL